MKLLAFLLLLFLGCTAVSLMELTNLDPCRECYENDPHDVCAKDEGTIYNLCVLQCRQYIFLHDGPCNDEELLDLVIQEK